MNTNADHTTMPTYVAFLRAIYHMKMEHLRRPFEAMGFSNVDTFLASGNVIFEAISRDTYALERNIDDALDEALDRETVTFIRSTDELTDIAQHRPFEDADLDAEDHTLYIAFLGTAPGDDVKQNLLSFTTDVDSFHIDGREVYWLCRTEQSESTFSGTVLEKTLDMPATLRNARTVERIVEKYT